MPRLVVRGVSPVHAIRDHPADPGEVAVDPVHARAADHEPAAAVDPRSPAAEVGQQIRAVAIVELVSDLAQRRDGERSRRVVVEPEVDVRALVGRATSRRAAEHDRRHAADGLQALGDPERHFWNGRRVVHVDQPRRQLRRTRS
jgi:hypothetical protein